MSESITHSGLTASDCTSGLTAPVMICKNKDGKINHIDVGMCHRQFYFFGKWKPNFNCGDKKNVHVCEELNTLSSEYIKLLEEKI